MGFLAEIVPGAARRGGGREIWPETADEMPIVVRADSLRPGVDLVRLRAECSGFPLPPGTWCLYLGHREGMAIVLAEGTAEPVPVPPWSIDEPEFLPCDTVDPYEFEEGWAFGRFAQVKEIAVSSRVVGNVPDAFGRGVTKGYDDPADGRAYRPGSWAAYNDVVRELAVLFPNEHRAGELRRRRTLMAGAA